MLKPYKSDGLGGSYGVSCSLHMGTRKRITYKKFHFLFFLMLFSCIHKPDVSSLLHFSLILALQRSNEIYKTIRMNHPRTYKLAPYSKNTYFTHSFISFIFAIDLVLLLSFLSLWILKLIPAQTLSAAITIRIALSQLHHSICSPIISVFFILTFKASHRKWI